jgi:hypothetical protein
MVMCGQSSIYYEGYPVGLEGYCNRETTEEMVGVCEHAFKMRRLNACLTVFGAVLLQVRGQVWPNPGLRDAGTVCSRRPPSS